MAKSKWLNYSAPHRGTLGSAKPASTTVVAPTTLEQVARDYRELLTAISTRRQITRGGQSANVVFQAVDGKVLKVAFVTKTQDIFYTMQPERVEQAAPVMTLSLGFATEAELITARSMVPAAQAGQIDVLLKMVRDGETSPAPIRVEITNADQLQRDTVLTIKRGDDGKVSGATAMKV